MYTSLTLHALSTGPREVHDMSRVISLRLKDGEAVTLTRLARRFSRSPGETAALLLSEKLREEQFPLIEFRRTLEGRQAFVKGTGMAVWEVVLVARGLDLDTERTATRLEWPRERVAAALAYADVYPEEIQPILDEVEAMTADELRRRIPGLQEARV
jgi:hypothetical protein